jgi:hypothetical protein
LRFPGFGFAFDFANYQLPNTKCYFFPITRSTDLPITRSTDLQITRSRISPRLRVSVVDVVLGLTNG